MVCIASKCKVTSSMSGASILKQSFNSRDIKIILVAKDLSQLK